MGGSLVSQATGIRQTVWLKLVVGRSSTCIHLTTKTAGVQRTEKLEVRQSHATSIRELPSCSHSSSREPTTELHRVTPTTLEVRPAFTRPESATQALCILYEFGSRLFIHKSAFESHIPLTIPDCGRRLIFVRFLFGASLRLGMHVY